MDAGGQHQELVSAECQGFQRFIADGIFDLQHAVRPGEPARRFNGALQIVAALDQAHDEQHVGVHLARRPGRAQTHQQPAVLADHQRIERMDGALPGSEGVR